MESDIEYLVNRLGKIDGFGNTGDSLLSIIRSKKIPEKKAEPIPAPAPAPALVTENSAEAVAVAKEENGLEGKGNETTEEIKEKTSAESQ